MRIPDGGMGYYVITATQRAKPGPRVGLVARSDDRGLGMLAKEWHDHLLPERTLVIDMGILARGFVQHFDRYPGATVVPFRDGLLPQAECRAWLDGLDIAVGMETFYDARFAGWCRDAGARSLLVQMPEFARPEMAPAVSWAPTHWRLDLLPRSTRVVPVPVTPPEEVSRQRDGVSRARDKSPTLRVLHVAGHRAAQDRNGTGVLAQALRLVRAPLHVQIECQDRRMPPVRGGLHVTVRTHLGGRADRWEMYAGHDLLVMPRRYGGLSLPTLEAMACGIGVVMTDVEPNREWPIVPVRTLDGFPGEIQTPGGAIEVHRPDPAHLAAVLTALADDPAMVAILRERATSWARANTWEALAPLYRAELERAAVPVA